jgi:8-oxo-dGTP diphosphatase
MRHPIEVVGAAIRKGDCVLAAQRGPEQALAGQWEFPGGKVERGESLEQALIREVREELGCEIAVGKHVTTTTHVYDFATIRLATYYAALTAGTPTAIEHADVRWIPISEMAALLWAPADIPTVRMIVEDASTAS